MNTPKDSTGAVVPLCSPFPFECENCGHKPTPKEVLDHRGDCAKCGDTVITYTVDAAECIVRLMANMELTNLTTPELEKLLLTDDGKGKKVKAAALAELKNRYRADLFTVEEIAQYIAGWTMGTFEEVAKVAEGVLHNARTQLECDQDGIAACKKRGSLFNPDEK